MSQLKHSVFWPPFLILLLSAIYSLVDVESFLAQAKFLNDGIIENFGWLFSASMLFFLGMCVWIYFSPIGKIRIGGAEAKPILSRWRWFTVTICTTVAVGILLWGTAEPLYHMHQPPTGLDITPNTPEAARFALSTMFMHWSFLPYGVYTFAGVLFALTYYNLKQPFSLGALLYPLIGERAHGPIGTVVDAVCLYSLVAGMAASLGTGILMLAGGLEEVLGIPQTPFGLACIAVTIVGMFVISAASGLLRGIQVLSDWNVKAFMLLSLFVFVTGPTIFILSFGVEAIGDFLQNFFSRAIYTGAIAQDSWAQNWTVFYWANWFAWTPISALFLGRLGLGYTVREFIHTNLLFPSLFVIFWMMVFSGTALHVDFINGDPTLYTALTERAAQNVSFELFKQLPMTLIISVAFLLISFLSYVTAADSNTSAMSSISTTGISPENPESPLHIKVIWGATIGIIAWVMVAFAGIDGIRMASNLGGFPALFLILAVSIGMIRLLRDPKKLE